MHGHGMNLIQRIAKWINDEPNYHEETGFEINARNVMKANKGIEIVDLE